MDDVEARRARPQAPHRPEAVDESSAARTREHGLRDIARAQIACRRRLSKLSVAERRRALAQWLRGMQP
jgi:hypothetical protein